MRLGRQSALLKRNRPAGEVFEPRRRLHLRVNSAQGLPIVLPFWVSQFLECCTDSGESNEPIKLMVLALCYVINLTGTV